MVSQNFEILLDSKNTIEKIFSILNEYLVNTSKKSQHDSYKFKDKYTLVFTIDFRTLPR